MSECVCVHACICNINLDACHIKEFSETSQCTYQCKSSPLNPIKLVQVSGESYYSYSFNLNNFREIRDREGESIFITLLV